MGEVSFDLAKAVDRKDGVVKKLVGGIEQLLKGNKIEVIRGDGFVEAAGKVSVTKADGSGRTLLQVDNNSDRL